MNNMNVIRYKQMGTDANGYYLFKSALIRMNPTFRRKVSDRYIYPFTSAYIRMNPSFLRKLRREYD